MFQTIKKSNIWFTLFLILFLWYSFWYIIYILVLFFIIYTFKILKILIVLKNHLFRESHRDTRTKYQSTKNNLLFPRLWLALIVHSIKIHIVYRKLSNGISDMIWSKYYTICRLSPMDLTKLQLVEMSFSKQHVSRNNSELQSRFGEGNRHSNYESNAKILYYVPYSFWVTIPDLTMENGIPFKFPFLTVQLLQYFKEPSRKS